MLVRSTTSRRRLATFATVISTVLLWLPIGGAAHAQPRLIELELPEAQPHEQVTFVPAPHVRLLAISESASALVLAHEAEAEHDLSIVSLDEQGALVAESRRDVNLPMPAPLKDQQARVLAIEVHPTEPLIYLWRDIEPKSESESDASAALVHEHFDHLLVYEIKPDLTLKLVQSTCRGEAYAFGMLKAAMALDVERDRLYLPNTLGPRGDVELYHQMAYAEVDDAGRVKGSAGTPTLVAQPGNKFLYRPHEGDHWPYGYTPISEDRVIVSSRFMLMTWAMDHTTATFFRYPVPGAGTRLEFSVHPERPVVYVTSPGVSQLSRVRHSEGFLTLLPQNVRMESATLVTTPIVTADGAHVIVGDREEGGRVLLLALDETGDFTGEIHVVALPGEAGGSMALAYSPKFDRIYVRTNELPADATAQANE